VRRILVTGASGWLGQSAISYLLKNSFSPSEIFATASTKKSLSLGNLGNLQVEDFNSFETKKEIDGVIHLSFLTRDKLNDISADTYVGINQKITSKAVSLIRTLKPNWVVNVSSGAIFDRNTKKIEENLKINPYGFLKAFEEKELKLVSKEIGANLVIGRLWGASGYLMPINRAYALSDFIYQAIKYGKILIKADKKVFRRYVDSEMFMGTLIESALAGENYVIDSGGPLVEIGELASIITGYLGLHEVLRPEISSSEVDDYYSRSERFREVSNKFNLPIIGIHEQVSNTIMGHKRSILQ
jgi:nucleoside-diphosphate-sugar epimerase